MFGFFPKYWKIARKSVCLLVVSSRSPESLTDFVTRCRNLTCSWSGIQYIGPEADLKRRPDQAPSGEIVVVTDDRADIADLQRMVEPLECGRADAVLSLWNGGPGANRLSPLPLWNRLINEFAGCPELESASFMHVPFALTRDAWRTAGGLRMLMHPAEAHVRLIQSTLRILVHESSGSPSSSLPNALIAERLEAFLSLQPPPRGRWTDGERRRDLVERLNQGTLLLPPFHRGADFSPQAEGGARKTLSVIIPVRNEEATIGEVIREARKLAPSEILVVVNGSSDRTESIAREQGAGTIVFQEPLGTDVGRAIGAYAAQGELLLFLDGDFVIPGDELRPFTELVSTRCDLAVNRLNHHLQLRYPPGTVTALKYALNTALGREELENASMVSVPFAMNRRALEVIHWSQLLCPPKAYALGLLGGLRCLPANRIEVDRMNRYRPWKHASAGERFSPAAMQIIGDHIEALHVIKDRKGE